MLGKLRLSRAGALVRGRRVLVRADLNVPLREGAVADATRIDATVPTLEAVLRESPAAVVVASHLGRPDGRVRAEASLRPVAAELARRLGRHVRFFDDCVGAQAVAEVPQLRGGEVVLLENLRFHAEEEGKGVGPAGEKVRPPPDRVRAFAAALGALGEVFVNDAFGTAHRPHASMTGVALPVRMAGLLMERELEFLAGAVERPRRPLVLALGGAKLADKLPLLRNLLALGDELLLGGAMGVSLLAALHGMPVGASLFDATAAAALPALAEEARRRGVRLTAPLDLVVAPALDRPAEARVVDVAAGVPPGWTALDVGPRTVQRFRETLLAAGTVVLNGPMGAFEASGFAAGSVGVVEALCEATARGTLTIVGGGDSARLVASVPGAAARLSHISTGGGATLELLEGKRLPGVDFLSNADEVPHPL